MGKHIQPIKHLQNAEIETRYGSKVETHRVILIADNQKIPLTEEYVGGIFSGIDRHVIRIKAFINSPRKSSLYIHENHRWILYLVGGFFTIIGAFIFISRSILTWLLGKLLDQLFDDAFKIKPQDNS